MTQPFRYTATEWSTIAEACKPGDREAAIRRHLEHGVAGLAVRLRASRETLNSDDFRAQAERRNAVGVAAAALSAAISEYLNAGGELSIPRGIVPNDDDEPDMSIDEIDAFVGAVRFLHSYRSPHELQFLAPKNNRHLPVREIIVRRSIDAWAEVLARPVPKGGRADGPLARFVVAAANPILEWIGEATVPLSRWDPVESNAARELIRDYESDMRAEGWLFGR